jgi:acetyl-CoA acetyltransferase
MVTADGVWVWSSGPAFAIAKLLKKNNLSMDDIGVWEIHEAFAGQV